MSILGHKEALVVASTYKRNIKNGIHKKEAKLIIPFYLNECCVRVKANDAATQRRSPERKTQQR
jgi:hypothetical protein